MTTHNFWASHEQERKFIEAHKKQIAKLTKKFLPDTKKLSFISDVAQQKRGIDAIAYQQDGYEYFIDYKICYKYQKTGNIAIETVSHGTTPGWAVNPKDTHLIAYLTIAADRTTITGVLWFPAQHLPYVVRKYGDTKWAAWEKNVWNVGYTSKILAVPYSHASKQAIQEVTQ